ncbi:hypothetical protein AYO40_00215 [Planctomycetaceae bacterium SCGC AG-212-D15]|nr:hypothetical protein AYO40_00215 [Planctomycetaceae bacterium SCGC AG-212-D15]
MGVSIFRSPASHPLRLAVLITAAVALYAVLVQLVVRPSHLHESLPALQSFSGILIAVDSLLQLPGDVMVSMYGLRVNHHTPTSAWLAAVVANAFVYFAMSLTAAVTWRQVFHVSPPNAGPDDAPAEASGSVEPLLTRRRFLARGVLGLGAGAALGAGYALVVEPRNFDIRRLSLAIRGLPASLDGLRIIQLTDIHHGPWLSRAFVRGIVDATNRLEPDLFLLTGDYVLSSPEYIRPVAQELGRLRPGIGTLAVLGNHDWWEDGERMREELVAAGIPVIDNTRRIVTPDRRLVESADDGLAIGGVGDLWEDRQDYRGALGGLPVEMPRLLLSHNPDVAEETGLTRGGERVDLMLSGHTHGGQVRLPFLGTPAVPSRYGLKYAQGLVQGPRCPVYICRGIGMSVLPIRFAVPPEIALLEIRVG